MPLHCGVLNCRSNAKYVKKSFYRLPCVLRRGTCFVKRLSALRRKKWLLAIKRSDITELKAKYMRVCEDHFVTGKPAAVEDINHPDWIPSIRLGYGNTSDRKYIRCLRSQVLKHTKTSLLQLQALVAESTIANVGKIDVNSIPDSIYDISGCQHESNNDTDGDTTSDNQRKDSIDDATDDDQNAVNTDVDANDSRRKDSIVHVPDHQYTLHTYRDINYSQGQECRNDKVPSVNVDDKVPSDCVDDLGDCNLSTSFLSNLTKLRQTSSVSVHVQTDLKTTDLDYLNKYCEATRRKLTEANQKIKLLNLLLNSKSAQNPL